MRMFIAMLAAVVLPGCAGSNLVAFVPMAAPAKPVAMPASPAAARTCRMKPLRRNHGYASFTGPRSGLLHTVSAPVGGTGRCATRSRRTIYADLFWNAFNRV